MIDSRGQISLEYLLLVLIAIVILGSITIPLIGTSIDASSDVSQVSEASTAVTDIMDAVNIIYANGPGAKRTLDIYIPDTMRFITGNKTVSLIVPLSNSTNKSVNKTTDFPVNNQSVSVTRGWHKVTIMWNGTNNYISISIL